MVFYRTIERVQSAATLLSVREVKSRGSVILFSNFGQVQTPMRITDENTVTDKYILSNLFYHLWEPDRIPAKWHQHTHPTGLATYLIFVCGNGFVFICHATTMLTEVPARFWDSLPPTPLMHLSLIKMKWLNAFKSRMQIFVKSNRICFKCVSTNIFLFTISLQSTLINYALIIVWQQHTNMNPQQVFTNDACIAIKFDTNCKRCTDFTMDVLGMSGSF